MRIPLSLIVLASITVGGGVAGADLHKIKAAKVQVDIPKKWTVTATDELVKAASANNEVALVVWVVDSPDVKEAVKKLEGELYSSIQNLKWVDKTKKLTVNKLKGTWIEGVGVSSRSTQLDVIVFVAGPTTTKKGVILLAVVDHEKYAANRSAIQAIFGSLKPTK
ncbi:MAG TPA: hypothetical protein VIV11_30615 [Kofleriaceae bacterium]